MIRPRVFLQLVQQRTDSGWGTSFYKKKAKPFHIEVAWPSGLRRWFKAPVSSEAWVRIPPLPGFAFIVIFILTLLTGQEWLTFASHELYVAN